MNKKLLALYGLKFNPFAPDIPVEALQMTPRMESFAGASSSLPARAGSRSFMARQASANP